MQQQYVQLAEIDVDPAQLAQYTAAVTEQIETALRVEPGVLLLCAVAAQDNPAHITVFEIYRDMDAYKSHLEAPHFKKYKSSVAPMVKALRLISVSPVMLGSKLAQNYARPAR
jgi:quinol monooxygenase YgiN